MFVRLFVVFCVMFLCIITISSAAKKKGKKKVILYNHGIRYCEQQCMATCDCRSFSYDKETLRCVMFKVWWAAKLYRRVNRKQILQSKWAGCPHGKCDKLQLFFLSRQHGCKESRTRSKPKKSEHNEKIVPGSDTASTVTTKLPLIIEHAVLSAKPDNTTLGFERKLKRKDNRIQVAGQAAKLNKIIRLDIKGLETPLNIVGMATRHLNQHRLFILGVPERNIKVGYLLYFKEQINTEKDHQTVTVAQSDMLLLNGGMSTMTSIKHIALDTQLQVYAICSFPKGYKVMLFKINQWGGYKSELVYEPKLQPRGIHVMPNEHIILASKNFMQFFVLKRGKMKIIRIKPTQHTLDIFTSTYVSFSPNSNYVYSVNQKSPYKVECFYYNEPYI